MASNLTPGDVVTDTFERRLADKLGVQWEPPGDRGQLEVGLVIHIGMVGQHTPFDTANGGSVTGLEPEGLPAAMIASHKSPPRLPSSG